MGFEEWLLQMGIDPAAFMELPPQVQDAYKKAHASFSNRNGGGISENAQWDKQLQREQQMYNQSRTRARDERQEQRQTDFDSARDAQTLMAMFGPKFRGGWGR